MNPEETTKVSNPAPVIAKLDTKKSIVDAEFVEAFYKAFGVAYNSEDRFGWPDEAVKKFQKFLNKNVDEKTIDTYSLRKQLKEDGYMLGKTVTVFQAWAFDEYYDVVKELNTENVIYRDFIDGTLNPLTVRILRYFLNEGLFE